MSEVTSATEALARLREGNERFVRSLRSVEAMPTAARRNALVGGQSPFAIILSCSDSRVPAELVFDCGLGDLFVVRVAGNIVAPSLVGSIEFAAATFDTKLVVVMGHTQCGAVTATIRVLMGNGPASTPNIHDIVERITPAVDALVDPDAALEDVLALATRANVRASVEQLRRGSQLLKQLTANAGLLVVGAEYSLETGVVTFFDM